MNEVPVELLLADDDKDDCDLFRDVLDELQQPVNLHTVNDGEGLMQLLTTSRANLPDILFLDLNMPRKNGFECLSEIRQDKRLKELPVIIFSTSFDKHIVNQLYHNGATFYIRKPNEFGKLKSVIQTVLSSREVLTQTHPSIDQFVLSS